MFSGEPREESLAHFLKHYGWACTDVDIVLDQPDMDLLSDAAWERWARQIEGGVFGWV